MSDGQKSLAAFVACFPVLALTGSPLLAFPLLFLAAYYISEAMSGHIPPRD